MTAAFAAPTALPTRAHLARPRAAPVRAPVRMAAPVARRAVLAGLAALTLTPRAASAFGPSKTSMTGDYKSDAGLVLESMRAACELARGTPGMTDTVGKTRKEMNDFVALYRRNEKVSGSTSFSTLYTAINTLSGHYASYGSNYPVPDKRKKRLAQQFVEIERALSRGR